MTSSPAARRVILGIDAGTTGVRTFAIDDASSVVRSAYREFPQYFPQPGWVEHDPEEIWDATLATLTEVVRACEDAGDDGRRDRHHQPARDHRGVGPLDRAGRCTGRSCGRTGAPRTAATSSAPPATSRSSASAPASCSTPTSRPRSSRGSSPRAASSARPTSRSAPSTRGCSGSSPAARCTRPSRRTRAARCCSTSAPATGPTSSARCSTCRVPRSATCSPTSGRFGTTVADAAAGLTVPVSGMAGDQQSALFGQACFEPGMAKNTYGTGSFVLVNLGPTAPPPVDGLLTTVAWKLGDVTTYAMEGAIFVTGAAVQWLRDELQIIERADEIGPLAASVPDAGGVMFVPAFTGLGSPHWDPYARGTVLGLTRGSGRAQLARAAVEAMAYQTADVVDAVRAASGTELAELRVDGGASVMDVLCQFQADVLGVPVRRPAVQETTALGAAYLAGHRRGRVGDARRGGVGVARGGELHPARLDPALVTALLDTWHRAVERSPGLGPGLIDADVSGACRCARLCVASARSDRSSSWARISCDASSAIGRSTSSAAATSSGRPSPANERPVSASNSSTRSSAALRRAAGAAGRRRGPRCRRSRRRRACARVRSSRPATRCDERAVVLAHQQPDVDELPHQPARMLAEQLVHLGEGHRLAAVVAPARAQHLVDAEPVGHGLRSRAGADETLDRLELEPALLELGDELEPLDVLLGVRAPRVRRVAARGSTPSDW